MHKPIILTLVATYLPGYKGGGPTRSIANLVSRLGDEFDFRIITADRDLGDNQPYSDVAVDEWIQIGKGRVYYCSPSNQRLNNLARLIRTTAHDLLYLNSFLQPIFTIRPLIARRLGLVPEKPLLVAPRGEFSSAAWALKGTKKWLYLRAAKMVGLYSGATWHATSSYEDLDIRERCVLKLGDEKCRNIIAAEVVGSFENQDTAEGVYCPRPAGAPLRVCFLSRICPMKNLDYALSALTNVTAPLSFDIYGTKEDIVYWNTCQEKIKGLPKCVSVRYNGVVKHSEVAKTLAQHDLLFLPTRGENFGHVIYESLAAGVPVLISDQTPWRDLAVRGVGWDLPLSEPERFSRIIESYAALSAEARTAQRRLVAAYARGISAQEATLVANRNMFMAAIANGVNTQDNVQ